MAQITQTFKALLKKKWVRRAWGRKGRISRITLYPAHLTIEYRQ
jgi:hypothetical protein